MNLKSIFIPFLLLISIVGQAQHHAQIAYDAALKNILLLKNEKVLPISNLEKQKIAYIHVGENEDKTFLNTLEKYAKISAFTIPEEGDLTEMLPLFQEILSNHNLLILKYKIGTSIGPTIKSFINYLSKNSKMILAINGTANAKDIFKDFNPDALLLTLNSGLLEESLSAQAIFGAVSLQPQTMKTYFDDFPISMSLFLKSNNRLGYTNPAIVEIDSALLSKRIARIVKTGINNEAFPGAQILVAKNGKVIYHKSFGFHTYENESPVKTSDIYDLASVTKITATLPVLMQLHGNGKFNINASWDKYYPAFKKSNKGDLKFKSILSHNARLQPGVPNWQMAKRKSGKFKWFTVKKKPSEKYNIQLTESLYLHRKYREKILTNIKKSKLRPEYGYKYSGIAFYIFPDMLTSMLNQDFETYLVNQFYKPLGASTLGYKPLDRFQKEDIIPTEMDSNFRETLMHGIVHDEGANMMGQISGNAGLFSNTNDLAKLLQMYLNKGEYGGKRYISSKSIDRFTKCHYCEDGNRRGLGFDKPMIDYVQGESHTAKEASPLSYGHSGYTGTYVWMDPKYDLLFIFMSNRVHPTRDHRKIYELDIRPKIQESIYDAMYEWKKNAARAKME